MGQVTWFIWQSDQMNRIRSVLRAEGRIHNGDLADCVNREILVRKGELQGRDS